jgi:hypothetical protein
MYASLNRVVSGFEILKHSIKLSLPTVLTSNEFLSIACHLTGEIDQCCRAFALKIRELKLLSFGLVALPLPPQ